MPSLPLRVLQNTGHDDGRAYGGRYDTCQRRLSHRDLRNATPNGNTAKPNTAQTAKYPDAKKDAPGIHDSVAQRASYRS